MTTKARRNALQKEEGRKRKQKQKRKKKKTIFLLKNIKKLKKVFNIIIIIKSNTQNANARKKGAARTKAPPPTHQHAQ